MTNFRCVCRIVVISDRLLVKLDFGEMVTSLSLGLCEHQMHFLNLNVHF